MWPPWLAHFVWVHGLPGEHIVCGHVVCLGMVCLGSMFYVSALPAWVAGSVGVWMAGLTLLLLSRCVRACAAAGVRNTAVPVPAHIPPAYHHYAQRRQRPSCAGRALPVGGAGGCCLQALLTGGTGGCCSLALLIGGAGGCCALPPLLGSARIWALTWCAAFDAQAHNVWSQSVSGRSSIRCVVTERERALKHTMCGHRAWAGAQAHKVRLQSVSRRSSTQCVVTERERALSDALFVLGSSPVGGVPYHFCGQW